jgi:beta-phosphoglucomutase-like phosphatase (HAD superfamily)
MVRPGAVLMEFDGVLAETTQLRREALRSVLLEDGVQVRDQDLAELSDGFAVGEAMREVARLHFPPIDDTALDLLVLRAERAYAAAIGRGFVLVEGARRTVERLAQDARVGVVSRLHRNELQQLISMAGMEDYMSVVIGAEDAYPHKPAAAPYRAALIRLQRAAGPSAPETVLALEDSLSGIRSARAAGVRCVAVGPVPAHVAMEADGYTAGLRGHDLSSLAALLDA